MNAKLEQSLHLNAECFSSLDNILHVKLYNAGKWQKLSHMLQRFSGKRCLALKCKKTKKRKQNIWNEVAHKARLNMHLLSEMNAKFIDIV